MNTATFNSTTIERHTERKFIARVSLYTVEVTAQSDGRYFGTIAIGRSYLETYSGYFESQSDAVKFLLTGIKREQAADAAASVTISESDIVLPEGFHSAEEIMDAAFTNPTVYNALQAINSKITDPDNWKNPVRIQREGIPAFWIEAATGFFSGCTMNNGLYWAGENWDYLYCAGYYVKIGA